MWKGAEKPLYSCAILTTTPNDIVRPLHDRMPVVISRDLYSTWLDPKANALDTHAMLKPATNDFFERVAVKREVNKVKAEGPQLLDTK